jgi:tryptophan 2,3-dioxygenase
MNPPKSDDVKARIRSCGNCERLMDHVTQAMRRHGSDMVAARQLAKTDLTEEQRQEARTVLVASFNEAQRAWNAYRDHLRKHGLLPVSDES